MKILVVDDEIKICESLKEILADLGHSVSIANKGEDALKILESEHFELVFLDIKMPDIYGEYVIKEIRGKGWQTKIVVVSAISDELIQNYMVFLGADHYITKPFKISQIIQATKPNFAQA